MPQCESSLNPINQMLIVQGQNGRCKSCVPNLFKLHDHILGIKKCASIYMAKGKIYFDDFYISHLVGQNPLSVLLVWIRMLRHIPTLIETKEVAWISYETSSTLQKSS